MKIIQQETTFSPIALILETREEASLLWSIMQEVQPTTEQQALATKVSDWISNEAHL